LIANYYLKYEALQIYPFILKIIKQTQTSKVIKTPPNTANTRIKGLYFVSL